MEDNNQHLETIKDIRNMMERSSRFVSLNGLAGVFVGLFALAGALAAYLYIGDKSGSLPYYEYAKDETGGRSISFLTFFIADASLVLLLSVVASSILTMRKAKKAGLKIWDPTAKRLLINMMIPLICGGLFCLIIVYHGIVGWVAPAMLIFYGLALVNASKYTLEDIRFLGLLQIILGLLAAVFISNGLVFWTLGFGLLHIVYGIMMYFKYER